MKRLVYFFLVLLVTSCDPIWYVHFNNDSSQTVVFRIIRPEKEYNSFYSFYRVDSNGSVTALGLGQELLYGPEPAIIGVYEDCIDNDQYDNNQEAVIERVDYSEELDKFLIGVIKVPTSMFGPWNIYINYPPQEGDITTFEPNPDYCSLRR